MRSPPALARPLTVVADAQVELGRYDGGRAHSIQRLVDTKPDLAAYARASYLSELGGDLRGAIEAMRLAVSAGGGSPASAYVQALLGDLQLGGRAAGGGARRLPRRAALAAALPRGARGARAGRRRAGPARARRSPGCAGPRGCCR